MSSCSPCFILSRSHVTDRDLEGTGKSLLLRAIIEALRKKFTKNPDFLAVTASTGIAAQNIGGAHH